MKAYFERSWKERLIMKINRLALFAASVHCAEGGNILSVCLYEVLWAKRSLIVKSFGKIRHTTEKIERKCARPLRNWAIDTFGVA